MADDSRERALQLKALAKEQMGRVERTGLFGALGGLAQHLEPNETAELLFGGQIDNKMAAVAPTDRRLLAAYGMLGRSHSIDYQAINQVKTGLTEVEVDGSGVDLEIKAVGRRDELVAAINERRRRAAEPPANPSAQTQADDPVSLLARLGELRASTSGSSERSAGSASPAGRG